MMKRAIPVEEWAKENLQPYRSEAGEIHRAFTDPDRQDDDSIWWFHHYMCPSGGHLLLQNAYIFQCIFTHNLQYLQKGLEDGHLDPNARGDRCKYSTPLHMATKMRNAKAIQLLIDHGADIHAKDGIGFTPTDYATLDEGSCLLLLKYGGQIHGPDRDNHKQRQWIKRVERTIQLLGGAPLPTDIIRHIHTFIK